MKWFNVLNNKGLSIAVVSALTTIAGAGTCFSATVQTPMAEDLNGNGSNIYNVANLSSSNVYAMDIIALGPYVDVRAYASFSDAIDDIGATEKTLLIPDQQSVTANKTVPSNLSLEFLQGGSLSISAGATVTINGPIKAPVSRIFSGSGSVAIGAGYVKEACPQWWGATGDGVTDDTAALQAALTAYDHVYLPAGTYLVSSVLIPKSSSYIIGAGLDSTVVKNNGIQGAVLYAPGARSRLDGLTIDGNSVTNSIGIYGNNTYRPYLAGWGAVRVKNCLDAGIKFILSGLSGMIAYNNFGTIQTYNCAIGVQLQTDTAPPAMLNANRFEAILCGSCATGLAIAGADGNSYGAVVAESCSTGIKITKGISNKIFAGSLKSNTLNLDVGDNPDVMGFWYGGNTDSSSSWTNKVRYTESHNRSDLYTFDSGKEILMAGRWFFQELSGAGDAYITNPRLRGPRLTWDYVTSGATISAASKGYVYLGYASSTQITNLSSAAMGQLVLFVAGNTNAYFNDNTTFYLNGNWRPNSFGDSLLLMYEAYTLRWIEIRRTDV